MAVVGAGLIGVRHAEVYADYDRCRLAVVCDVQEARARELAERFGCDWCTDVWEIATSDVDGVSLATPDFAHTEPALALLAAGKHVLFEKPLTTDLAEAGWIVEAVRERGVKAMMNLPRRWNPHFVAVKRAVEAGEIGRPVMGYVRLSNTLHVPTSMLEWAGRSGPQWFLLPHSMDHMRWVLGQEARRVFATGRKGVLTARGIDAFDAMHVVVDFDDAFATFETTWIIPENWPEIVETQFVLYGSEGRIGLDGNAVLLATNLASSTRPFGTGNQSVYGKSPSFTVAEIRHFVDCLADDQPPAGATVEDGRAVVAMIRAAELSIEKRQPIDVANLIRDETQCRPSPDLPAKTARQPGAASESAERRSITSAAADRGRPAGRRRAG
ncbi:MAG: Gfo/Idh/MocA family protein [Thermomicrobiales bacterium]